MISDLTREALEIANSNKAARLHVNALAAGAMWELGVTQGNPADQGEKLVYLISAGATIQNRQMEDFHGRPFKFTPPDPQPHYDRAREVFIARVFEAGFSGGSSFGLNVEIDAQSRRTLAFTGAAAGRELPVACPPTLAGYVRINETFFLWLAEQQLRFPV
jgi:hypothetical protein